MTTDNLEDYLEQVEYLPQFMRQHTDAQLIFRIINEAIRDRKENAELFFRGDLNFVDAHIYTVDYFLHWMGCHGYTLQKSRKRVGFYDIDKTMEQWADHFNKQRYEMLNGYINGQEEE